MFEHDRGHPVPCFLGTTKHAQTPVDKCAVNSLGNVDEACGAVRLDQRKAPRRRLGDKRSRQDLLIGIADLNEQPRRLLFGEAADEPPLSDLVVAGPKTRREHELTSTQELVWLGD